MGHSEHSDHHHEVDEKSTRIMVLFCLALFFGMSFVGNQLFVASAHHETAATNHSASATHETDKTSGEAHEEESAPADDAEPHGKH